jgi:hypothetical protein
MFTELPHAIARKKNKRRRGGTIGGRRNRIDLSVRRRMTPAGGPPSANAGAKTDGVLACKRRCADSFHTPKRRNTSSRSAAFCRPALRYLAAERKTPRRQRLRPKAGALAADSWEPYNLCRACA